MSLSHDALRRFCLTTLIAACWPITSFCQTKEGAPQQLYLLAGTPTNNGTDAYAVNLYRVENGKALLVREVVSASDGLFAVDTTDDALFVLHPHGFPNSVSIIHIRKPELPDDVVFTTEGFFPLTRDVTAAERPGLGAEEMIPLLPNPSRSDYKEDLSQGGILFSVTGDRIDGIPRIQTGAWNEYKSLREDGAFGGPGANLGSMSGVEVGRNLAISIFGHTVVVDLMPPSLRKTNPSLISFIAVNRKYLLLVACVTNAQKCRWPPANGFFVHDRQRDNWSVISSPVQPSFGRLSGTSLRLFGDWLCFSYASGNQVIQNLADNRTLIVDSTEPNTEILNIRNDTLLYRLAGTIYQARIVDTRLVGRSIEATDMPDVHWAFWSGPINSAAKDAATPSVTAQAQDGLGAVDTSWSGKPFTTSDGAQRTVTLVTEGYEVHSQVLLCCIGYDKNSFTRTDDMIVPFTAIRNISLDPHSDSVVFVHYNMPLMFSCINSSKGWKRGIDCSDHQGISSSVITFSDSRDANSFLRYVTQKAGLTEGRVPK